MDCLAPFREIWLCDFEFSAPRGERPKPVCMVAREFRTSRMLRLWRDELHALDRAPIDTSPSTLFVSFFASAELACFLALDWPGPARILDLYGEFRRVTSGLTAPCGHGLLGALSWFGLDGLAAVEKESMRELAQRGEPYTADERRALLAYCETDVAALARLLPAILPTIDHLPQALLRGCYVATVAQMEWTGTPIDVDALAKLRTKWTAIQDRLIERIDAGCGIYSGRTFKNERFAAWLIEQGISWPRLSSGALDLSDECFHEMSRAFPDKVSPIRELRQSLSLLRLESLAVGSDGRNRCLLSPFGSRTGRNTPSNAAFIFGPSTWLRGLIRPAEGNALAYVDWEQQEFGVAGALSNDLSMMDAYASADPYLAFAKQAGVVPADATKETHKAERERFKVLSLAVQYGMGADALARKLDEAPERGRELIGLHRRTYPRYWQWSDAVEMTAMLTGRLQTTFGWTVHVGPTANPRSLRNFPLQANAGEMLRLGCILAAERGIRMCAPIHDALLIEAPADEIADAVAKTQTAMEEASKVVLAGFPLRTVAKIIRYPDRYVDPRGQRFWQTVWELIGEQTPTTDGTPVAHGTPSAYGAKPLPQAAPPSSFFILLSKDTADHVLRIDRPRELPASCRNDHAREAQTEAATVLQNGLSSRADPVALACEGDAVTRQGPGSGANCLARGWNQELVHSSSESESPTRMRNSCCRAASCDSEPRSGGPDQYAAEAGPLSGSDYPRHAGNGEHCQE
jgi:hypothetical protein